MYAIKICSSNKNNDWHLLKDDYDGEVRVWHKKEDAEYFQNHLGFRKSVITKIMSKSIIKRVQNKNREINFLKFLSK